MVQYSSRQQVQQSRQPRPVRGGEPDPIAVQLPFEHHDLVSQGEDFGVLVAVAHRQQPQQGHSVGHAEVRQSEQHTPSSRSARRRPLSRFSRPNPRRDRPLQGSLIKKP
jgi:hypothetical protein